METSYQTEVSVPDTSGSKHQIETDVRVVLCGSMSALPEIEKIRDYLAAHGIDALSPEPDDLYSIGRRPDAVIDAKRSASLRHISWIKDARTRAILVVNVDREGRHDYIGPNAFAEIAISFAEGRDIYLLQGMPTPYADELTAWGVRCLHGDLGWFRRRFARPRGRGKSRANTPSQAELFAES
jgi:hypothetical protein